MKTGAETNQDFQNTLYTGDNLYILNGLNSEIADLIYLDPPFNKNEMFSAPVGSVAAGSSFKDMWSKDDIDIDCLRDLFFDYPDLILYLSDIDRIHSASLKSYLIYMAQRLVQMHRILKPTGNLCYHCDQTAGHFIKILLDVIFGKKNFRNEIIWYYKNASRGKKIFAKSHDVIYWYSKSDDYIFNRDDILVPFESGMTEWRYTKGGQQEKEMPKGKTPDDVISMPSLNTMSKERTGYPTQKPLALLDKIIKALSNKNGLVLAPFCGCATTCVLAQNNGRHWIGIDIAEKSVELLSQRLSEGQVGKGRGIFKNIMTTKRISERTDVKENIKNPKDAKIREENLNYLFDLQEGEVIDGAKYCKCAGCGEKLNIKHMEIDHIIPKSKCGAVMLTNFQLLCGKCNKKKGNRFDYLFKKSIRDIKLSRLDVRF